MADATPQAKFRAAYRMVRLAFRGAERQTLKVDLQQPADYTPTCRRCNAGVAVTTKVAAALGWQSNDLTLCLYGQAVRIALGEAPPPRQSYMPRPLDFARWAEVHAWAADQQKAA